MISVNGELREATKEEEAEIESHRNRVLEAQAIKDKKANWKKSRLDVAILKLKNLGLSKEDMEALWGIK
jgi:hypothetical protein